MEDKINLFVFTVVAVVYHLAFFWRKCHKRSYLWFVRTRRGLHEAASIDLQGVLPHQLAKLDLEEMQNKEKARKIDDQQSWSQRLRQNYTATYPRVSRPANSTALEQALKYPFNVTAALLYPVSSEVSRLHLRLCVCVCVFVGSV